MEKDTGMDADDRRDEERVELLGGAVTITFPRNGQTTSDEGITLNLSTSGVAIYSDREMKEGTELNIHSAGVWDGTRQGKVMWCRKVTDHLYKIGIKIE